MSESSDVFLLLRGFKNEVVKLQIKKSNVKFTLVGCLYRIIITIITLGIPVYMILSLVSPPPSDAELEADYNYISEIEIVSVIKNYSSKYGSTYAITGEYYYNDKWHQVELGTIEQAYQKKYDYHEGQIIDGYVSKNNPEKVWSEISDLHMDGNKSTAIMASIMLGIVIITHVIERLIKRKKENKRLDI